MGKFVPASEMSLSDQVQIRREKLAQLQAEGMDPFVQTKFEFDSCSTEIKDHFEAMEGKTVSLAGHSELLPEPEAPAAAAAGHVL